MLFVIYVFYMWMRARANEWEKLKSMIVSFLYIHCILADDANSFFLAILFVTHDVIYHYTYFWLPSLYSFNNSLNFIYPHTWRFFIIVYLSVFKWCFSFLWFTGNVSVCACEIYSIEFQWIASLIHLICNTLGINS